MAASLKALTGISSLLLSNPCSSPATAESTSLNLSPPSPAQRAASKSRAGSWAAAGSGWTVWGVNGPGGAEAAASVPRVGAVPADSSPGAGGVGLAGRQGRCREGVHTTPNSCRAVTCQENRDRSIEPFYMQIRSLEVGPKIECYKSLRKCGSWKTMCP